MRILQMGKYSIGAIATLVYPLRSLSGLVCHWE